MIDHEQADPKPHEDQMIGRKPAQSNRAQSLLQLANKYGKRIASSQYVDECWLIYGVSGNLTVYGLPNHGARVMADLEGNRDWVEITQRRARHLIQSDWF